jgi:hypothetical protein
LTDVMGTRTSACDVTARTGFAIRRTNPLEQIAEKVEGLVAGVINDEEKRVADLREAIRVFAGLHMKKIEPFHVYLDLPERLLWNWALGQLDNDLAGLEAKIAELEDAVSQFSDGVGRVLECIGNPATLQDVASLLREGVAALATELAPQVDLEHLSVDNEWDSDAAERYTERAQLQGSEGLEELARRASLLADSLDGHCETEVKFWEGAADLVVEIVVFLVGLFFTMLGAVDMFGGAAAAAPTAGATLVVSALGLVSFIGGLVVTAVSGFMLVKSIADLINGAESSLAKTVEAMTSNAVPKGQSWPILAT